MMNILLWKFVRLCQSFFRKHHIGLIAVGTTIKKDLIEVIMAKEGIIKEDSGIEVRTIIVGTLTSRDRIEDQE